MKESIMDGDGKTTLGWVENGEIFSVAGKKIAVVRNGELFSLEDEPLNCHLHSGGQVRGERDAIPAAFKKLLKS